MPENASDDCQWCCLPISICTCGDPDVDEWDNADEWANDDNLES